MGLEISPIALTIHFNKMSEFLVLGLAPAILGLVGESSVSTIAHLGVSVWHRGCNILEFGMMIRAEFEKQFIFFFGPSLFGLSIALIHQVISRDYNPLVKLKGRLHGRLLWGIIELELIQRWRIKLVWD